MPATLLRFEDIAPRAWEHPADRAALETLRAIPGFDRVVASTLGRLNEWTMRKRMLGDAVEVTPDSHPRIWQTYQEVLWALDAPMYFIRRADTYLDLSGLPFREFWEKGASGTRATVGDFALHLSTLFPEVRLKTWIELRMADSPPPDSVLALSAMAKGVLYEPDCRMGAWDLVKEWPLEERHALLETVARGGFAARAGRHSIADLARELVVIAEEGLNRLARAAGESGGEAALLEHTIDRVRRGRTSAEETLDIWKLGGANRVTDLVRHTAYSASRSDQAG